ncbi:MAG: biotin/lipoate A/B protein ligase family protein [Gemmataceae bacterium]
MSNTQTGECKTPGGKLVAVTLSVADRRLAAARVHGDFFVHPEAAAAHTLAAIADALNGSPADLDILALTARIQAAVPFGVELLGTSPDAIAVAVRRAVSGNPDLHAAPPLDRIGSFTAAEIDRLTDEWTRLPWRLIPEVPHAPQMNVALDEVLTDAGAPTLRLWRWNSPAVIIGRCQSVTNEVDQAAAAEMGVAVVRRMTGGGAMFLQPHGAITYSLYLPESAVEGLTIRQSYEVCEAWVIRGLRELGVDAHHVPINDIACSEGKIGGAAQARRKGVVLHHTTIAYDMDPGEMVRVLRIGREKLKDKAVASAAKRVSPLVRQTGLSREAIVAHLFEAFQSRFGGTVSELTAGELAEAERLVRSKYGHPEWTNEFE